MIEIRIGGLFERVCSWAEWLDRWVGWCTWLGACPNRNLLVDDAFAISASRSQITRSTRSQSPYRQYPTEHHWYCLPSGSVHPRTAV